MAGLAHKSGIDVISDLLSAVTFKSFTKFFNVFCSSDYHTPLLVMAIRLLSFNRGSKGIDMHITPLSST